jgi:hypothetical protein
MTELQTLKLHSLKHILENLELNEMERLFDQINDIDVLEMFKKSFDKKKQEIYIVLDRSHYEFNISDLAKKFLQIYYPDFDIRIWCRHDPILVIIVKLFGDKVNIDESELYVRRYDMSLFNEYCITYNPNLGDYICIMTSNKAYINISPRPDNLFANIQKFANENNIELNIPEDFPKTGPYRIYDK